MGFFVILLTLNLLSVRAGGHNAGFHNWTLSDPKTGLMLPLSAD
jgi:hypothetical protein